MPNLRRPTELYLDRKARATSLSKRSGWAVRGKGTVRLRLHSGPIRSNVPATARKCYQPRIFWGSHLPELQTATCGLRTAKCLNLAPVFFRAIRQREIQLADGC